MGHKLARSTGAELSFRHPLIRQALYDSMPAALRAALHAEAARELATAGADTLRVAQQPSAAKRPGAGWIRAWLAEAAPGLVMRAPQLAVELLRWALEETPADDVARDALVLGLVRALIAVGGYEEAVRQASWALTAMTDPALQGETSQQRRFAHPRLTARHQRPPVSRSQILDQAVERLTHPAAVLTASASAWIAPACPSPPAWKLLDHTQTKLARNSRQKR